VSRVSCACLYACVQQVYARHLGEGEVAPKANQPTYAQLPATDAQAEAPPIGVEAEPAGK
jgi:hypothetical protein